MGGLLTHVVGVANGESLKEVTVAPPAAVACGTLMQLPQVRKDTFLILPAQLLVRPLSLFVL